MPHVGLAMLLRAMRPRRQLMPPRCSASLIHNRRACISRSKNSQRIAMQPGISAKTILPASLLSFLGGLLGLHRFCVGKVGTGILMALLTFTLFGIVISGLWNLIDLVMIVSGKFTDSNSRTLRNWT
jgi:TM2 domain-containing membrane protein YozV